MRVENPNRRRQPTSCRFYLLTTGSTPHAWDILQDPETRSFFDVLERKPFLAPHLVTLLPYYLTT